MREEGAVCAAGTACAARGDGDVVSPVRMPRRRSSRVTAAERRRQRRVSARCALSRIVEA